jgi:protein-tyrosine phosphatase
VGVAVRETGSVLTAPVRVCFVCSGNICRSPTAEVVLNRLAAERNLTDLVRAQSAGTGSWHAGDDMDERSRQTLEHAGYDVPRHIARQFGPTDFDAYDVVVALDGSHHGVLWWQAAEARDADAARAKIVMLRAFDPLLDASEEPDVADPYYGGRGGFTEVLEQVERSCAQLLVAIEQAVETGTELAQQAESPPR